MDGYDILTVLSLRDYNTRLVVLCTLLLGCACGMIGSFLLLRKRSLMGDTLSHATLPGVGIAFIISVLIGGDEKSLPLLLAGATITGLLGCFCVQFIRYNSRVKDDAAMGIVLSVFFGAGVALLGIIQTMPEGSAAGLESFIYGKTASMVLQDFRLLALVTSFVIITSIVLFKEFRILCFDQGYAASQGWPVKRLDLILLFLVTLVTVAGLQAVGLILVIALLITPAAAARFWTDRLDQMILLSGLVGALSGWLGASMSALAPRLPAGALIVLVAAGFFIFSLLFGSKQGLAVRSIRQYRLKRTVGRQHLLRALYEILEADTSSEESVTIRAVPFRQLRGRRTWSDANVRTYLKHSYQLGLIEAITKKDLILLTEAGLAAAVQVTRNHRLWELYLIEYADVAASRVDRDADTLEHVLGGKIVAELELKLQRLRMAGTALVPPSPHPIQPGD